MRCNTAKVFKTYRCLHRLVRMWGHHSRTYWCKFGAPLPLTVILARGSGHRLCGGPPVGGISSRRRAQRGIAGKRLSGPPCGGISSRRSALRGITSAWHGGPSIDGIRMLCYIECRCRIFGRILPRHRPRAVPPQRNLRIRGQRPGRILMRQLLQKNSLVCIAIACVKESFVCSM